MKYSFLAALLFPLLCAAQKDSFPKSWVGNWKGELQWFMGNTTEPKKMNMELHVQPTDSGGNFTWQIIYGKVSEDNRPYILMPKDTAIGHWVIDENNGIILDQYWVGQKLSGVFSVQNSTIINNYWMEKGKLYVEFYNISVKPVSTTGKGTDESPSVNSYQVKSYQKAVLQRSE